jgi:pimeloyl-ACP methyl ester carboxylesterase
MEQDNARSTISVQVVAGSATLRGNLTLPREPRGLVLFAHGSGSSRHSPRNRFVAQVLQQAEFGTLLIDLLTADEERVDVSTGHLRFDIDLLAKRLVGAVDWLEACATTAALPLGLFGASTGAAAALVAAANRPGRVRAVVSRGGRPDLAGPALPRVHAPVLLIVGSDDAPVLTLNRDAEKRLAQVRPKRLIVIPGATHLFEEAGALEQVAELAAGWFTTHLPSPLGIEV